MEKTKQLLEILTEISEGKGAYNEDRLIHASNTIEDMKRLALDGIKLLQDMGEPSSVQEFMDEIREWALVTFPNSTTTSKLKHLIKEAGEVIKEVDSEDHTIDHAQRRRVREEFADVFILFLNALSSQAITIDQLMEDAKKKMAENRQRKWGTPDEHGVVEHIREEKFKTSLTREEFREIKDKVCEALLHHDEDVKQHFLLEIGSIMVGSKQALIDSAEAQGYTIKEGRQP